jgi:predicted DNA-binding WGR domain protein
VEQASSSFDPDPGAAINALAALARQKRRRGYQDRAA